MLSFGDSDFCGFVRAFASVFATYKYLCDGIPKMIFFVTLVAQHY